MDIGSLLTNEVVTAGPRQSLAHVAQLMHARQVGTVVITEQDRPVGIITDRDLAIAMAVRGVSRSEAVQSVMTCPVATMDRREGVMSATRHMRQQGVRRVPVVDEVGRVVGVISADDVVLLLARELGNVAGAIEPEVAAVR